MPPLEILNAKTLKLCYDNTLILSLSVILNLQLVGSTHHTFGPSLGSYIYSSSHKPYSVVSISDYVCNYAL